MWLLLAFLSAALLGFYDAFKKQSLKDNAVLPVLFLNTVFSFHLRGFIVHGFTGSYEIYNEISKHGGLVSLSPRAEKTKLFSTLKERGITYPFLTETDTDTGIEEREILKSWNNKLSIIFNRDIEKEVEDTFFSYI